MLKASGADKLDLDYYSDCDNEIESDNLSGGTCSSDYFHINCSGHPALFGVQPRTS